MAAKANDYHNMMAFEKSWLSNLVEPQPELVKTDWILQRRLALMRTQHVLDRDELLYRTPIPDDAMVDRAFLCTKNTKLGLHLNPWEALLKTQKGELFMLNPWQHTKADEDGRPVHAEIAIDDPHRFYKGL
mmetsp:Transcript_19246/g.73931  ORF Transcript_19246/g.73931 Transcript_19246/m.73931 type:complete len:131 (-) Transcript_19246:61-453(-)|eukprot:CAMPEP_0114613214 /NCGR_PEP_ID=MMETSP0168-20121206/5016_1 /TAXON_ID=95228 ORGANISM="Vannella sp., Strain DIVA3 517/6/12" /NCGR_SAMPLE_ID=MMETSP0168 /ASSEMBLY_ACC=CAM_ASM_000044 /LENGTH=130 /DNA_ID=CAMNT_0001824211 /DNA_START=32 /DNA_END=424 /DNA_ORIENTATION=-